MTLRQSLEVTAAAHELARRLWAMVKHRRPCDPERPALPNWPAPGKRALYAAKPSPSVSPGPQSTGKF